MEPLPVYVQDQVPQSAFDALLTRIAGPISTIHPDARVILESFIESQEAPAYNGPGETEPPKPIGQYCALDAGPGSSTDALTRVKQEIVKELFNAITREDNEAIALLIQHNLVTAPPIIRPIQDAYAWPDWTPPWRHTPPPFTNEQRPLIVYVGD